MTKPSEPDYYILETAEGGTLTLLMDDKKLTELGVIALHIVAGSVYALRDDMKLHKLEEVKGFSVNTQPGKVREINREQQT